MIQTFTSNHSKMEVFIFLFDALFRPFLETHRVKGCDKNVSLISDSTQEDGLPWRPEKKYVILNDYNSACALLEIG